MMQAKWRQHTFCPHAHTKQVIPKSIKEEKEEKKEPARPLSITCCPEWIVPLSETIKVSYLLINIISFLVLRQAFYIINMQVAGQVWSCEYFSLRTCDLYTFLRGQSVTRGWFNQGYSYRSTPPRGWMRKNCSYN